MIEIVSTEPATSDNDTIIPLKKYVKFATVVANFFRSRDCFPSKEESILLVALRWAKWTKITQRIYYFIFFRVFIEMRALLHKNFSLNETMRRI